MTNVDKAKFLFDQGFNCSQSVLASFANELDITEEQALKLGACFGSGMGKSEVCGACTGALMALGIKYGQSDIRDLNSKQITKDITLKFLEKFSNENGTYLCRELLGCDLRTKEGIEYAKKKNLFTEFCPLMVISAVKIAENLLKKE